MRLEQPMPSRYPTLWKGLAALLFVTLAILITLGFLGLAGNAGDTFDEWLSSLFGLLRYTLPLIFIVCALHIESTRTASHMWHTVRVTVGGMILAMGLAGLIHSFRLPDSNIATAGGVLGKEIFNLLEPRFGILASQVVFTSMSIAGALIILTTSLGRLTEMCISFFFSLGQKAKKNAVALYTSAKKQTTFPFVFVRKTLRTDIPADAPSYPGQFEEYETDETLESTQLHHNTDVGIDESSLINDTLESTTRLLDVIPQKTTHEYLLPPLRLLKRATGTASAGDITHIISIIEKTFSTFGIPVEMGETRVGPAVTQYTLRPADGIKLARIVALHNDLALALAAHPIRIEAPIPGKSLVGIEVPNQKAAIVTLHDLLTDEEYEKIKQNFHFALGKDVSGKGIFIHLPSLPHVLVAGATGSGKTVCINTIILSLIFQHGPEDIKFIMVDPKRVELPLYNGIPHLLTPVITETSKTINALKWAINEMERRFDLLSKSKRRDISSYNVDASKRGTEKLPAIVFIVDELADLMATAGNEIEAGIIRLAQMARAVGIHLVLATQRPSVDVITGLIKANIPARIAFSVASLMDSRTILDASGAEKLLGRGDMLYISPSLSKPKRIQGAFISEEELKRVIEFIKNDAAPNYDETITNRSRQLSVFGETEGATDDPLYAEAKTLVIQAGKASASYLQRRLKIGYARAARLLDILEEGGVIGPPDGAKPREVLIQNPLSATMPFHQAPFNENDENFTTDESTDELR